MFLGAYTVYWIDKNYNVSYSYKNSQCVEKNSIHLYNLQYKASYQIIMESLEPI